MFCDQCGQKLPDNSMFCGICGAKQNSGTVNQQPPQMSQPSVPSPVQSAPPVRPVAPPVQPVTPPVQPVQKPMAQPQYQGAHIPTGPVSSVLSVGNYLGMLLLLCIPLVNIVLTLIWAFSAENPNKKNFALACILFFIICLVVGFLFSIVAGGLLMAIFSEMGNSF